MTTPLLDLDYDLFLCRKLYKIIPAYSEKMKLYKGGNLHFLYQTGNAGVSSAQFLNSYSDISSYNPSKSINIFYLI